MVTIIHNLNFTQVIRTDSQSFKLLRDSLIWNLSLCRARSPARWLVVNLSRYLSVGWDRFYKQGRFDTIGGPGRHWIPPPLSCAPIGAHLRDPPRGLTSERSPQIPFNQGLADAYLELFRHWFSSLQSLSPRRRSSHISLVLNFQHDWITNILDQNKKVIHVSKQSFSTRYILEKNIDK